MIYTVGIPGWRPARLNELLGKHWAVAQRRKNADAQRLLVELQNHRVPKATGKRKVILLWGLAKGERTPDPDGVWKSLLDGLVRAGALVDDNALGVFCAPVQFVRGTKGIVLTLEDIE